MSFEHSIGKWPNNAVYPSFHKNSYTYYFSRFKNIVTLTFFLFLDIHGICLTLFFFTSFSIFSHLPFTTFHYYTLFHYSFTTFQYFIIILLQSSLHYFLQEFCWFLWKVNCKCFLWNEGSSSQDHIYLQDFSSLFTKMSVLCTYVPEKAVL